MLFLPDINLSAISCFLFSSLKILNEVTPENLHQFHYKNTKWDHFVDGPPKTKFSIFQLDNWGITFFLVADSTNQGLI